MRLFWWCTRPSSPRGAPRNSKSPKATAASGMSSGRAGRRQPRPQRTWKVYRKAKLWARCGYEQWISQWRQTISHETECFFLGLFNCFNNLQFVFWIKLPASRGWRGIFFCNWMYFNLFAYNWHSPCPPMWGVTLTISNPECGQKSHAISLKLAGLYKKLLSRNGHVALKILISWKTYLHKKRQAQVHNEFYIANLKYTPKKLLDFFVYVLSMEEIFGMRKNIWKYIISIKNKNKIW